MAITWTDSPLIKKIKLPSGNEYFIADREAREEIEALEQAIAGGVSFIIAWDGTSTPVPASIPAGVSIVYQGVTYTGTLSADSATPGAFYLIHSDTQLDSDVYDEYVPVGSSGSKTWEKIGDTQVDLSDVVIGVTLNKATDVVLGEATTFTMPQTNVSFTGGTNDSVLGADTTFAVTSGTVNFGTPTKDNVIGEATTHNVTEPTITVTPSTTYLGAVSNGTANGITGFPNLASATFVQGVDVEQGLKMVTDSITGTNGTDTATLISDKVDSKLVTTTITGTNGTDTATLVSDKVSENLVTTTVTGVSGSTSASKATAATSQTTADGTTTSHQGTSQSPNATYNEYALGDVSVSNEVLSIKGLTLDTQTTTQFTFSDVTVPKAATSATTVATGALSSTGSGATLVKSFSTANKTLAKVAGAATTVATGSLSSTGSGATLVQSFSTADKTLAVAAAAAKTFATGALSSTGAGASVVTGVSITGSASAITSLGATFSTSAFLTGVKLSSYTASGTERYQVATGISSAFASGTAVTHNSDDLVAAITAMPTASFNTAITVGTNDLVSAVTSIGSGKISSTAITVGSNDKVTALTNGTTLSVTMGDGTTTQSANGQSF